MKSNLALNIHIPRHLRQNLDTALAKGLRCDAPDNVTNAGYEGNELHIRANTLFGMVFHCCAAASFSRDRIILVSNPEDILPGPLIIADCPDETGMHPETALFLRKMAAFREIPLWQGHSAVIVSHSPGTLGTKRSAQDILFTLNNRGWAIPGKALVESVNEAQNMSTRARIMDVSPLRALELACHELGPALGNSLQPGIRTDPSAPFRITALHSSTSVKSNTMALWNRVRSRLETIKNCRIQTLGLDSTSIDDCRGCNFQTCRHFGENGGCFYGGRITRETFPAIMDADLLMLLIPNYNDSPPANFLALFNRLTSLYHADSRGFFNISLCVITVSGYSGSDCVIKTAFSSLCLNKGFRLMPEASLHALANDPGEIENTWQEEDYVHADAFARRIMNSAPSASQNPFR
ncbi:MAG: hypothetical protein CVV64_11965 [Candidatus Wallbacteria bacterium HGW-Wallbacteria-1]|jgi:multimeric flavodoxin WrbA|uniref:NADPH-dependent FMN reductase-like domain-containing protein n=1 Tax=Candidatus Wallbacteria bacterium HGW-Wallbacteria-1 TaxID=2013854 RepID=A0A2N1PNL0_9BACT|nr:MAG: hypothetical protein CVV64_11965 [Candidatus Wallbacteria bacterium HGW-Wallbacteria-1]